VQYHHDIIIIITIIVINISTNHSIVQKRGDATYLSLKKRITGADTIYDKVQVKVCRNTF